MAAGASIESLEDWLIAIAQHTRETKEAVQNRPSATGPQAATGGNWFDKLQGRIESAVARGLMTATGQARSLANRGFNGTTEQAANTYAMDMLAKQFAAVFKPVMDGATYLAVQVEKRMKMMNGTEQNRLFGAVVGAGLGYQFGGGGPRGIVGGALLGAGIMGESTGMGAAGGALLGARFGPVGAAVGAAVGTVASSGDYTDLRRAGKSKFEAAFASIGMATFDLGYSVYKGLGGSGANPLDEARKRFNDSNPRPGSAEANKRRDVTPFQAEMGEAGSTAMRIQEAVIRSTAGAAFEEAGPLKPVIDLGLRILDELIKLGGGQPPPQSATAGR